MKKLKEIDLSKLILLYIAVNPVFDMMYTLFVDFSGMGDYGAFAPNQIFRILFIVLLLLNIKKIRDFFMLVIIGVYLLITLMIQNYLGYTLSVLTNINLIGKVIYFVATLIVISKLLQMNILSEKKLIKSLTVSAVIISVSILISPFGLGYKGYDYIFSFRGLFGYANFVSGCLLGILPILMYLYKGRIRVVLILMDYVSLLLLGSKASVVGGTGIIVIMLCYCLKYELSISLRALLKQKKIRIIFSVIISCLAGVMGIYLSKQIQYFIDSQYSVINFLTSHRVLQTEYAAEFISKLDKGKALTILFGLGSSKVAQILNERIASFYTIEQDYNGIMFYFGVIAFLMLCIYTIKIIYMIWQLLKKNCQKNFPFALSFIVMLFQSILVGHVIYVPLASVYFASVISIITNHYLEISQKENRESKI
ncbi:MAG: hypothetical protein HFH88_02460 [Lachnospiraceae bacterium]|nr:hypothetical protein [Lachnospiraceae bacterium]